MKTLIILIALAFSMSAYATENAVRRFDKANEELIVGEREHVNMTSREITELAKEQGTSVRTKNGFPVANTAQVQPVPELHPSAGVPAPTYRTLGEAAKAGIDPFKVLKPTTPLAEKTSSTVQKKDSEIPEMYYYAGGFLLFVVLGGLGFLLSLRNPVSRES